MYMCARVAIDLKLFNIISDSAKAISLAELATKTGVEEQLLSKFLPGHEIPTSPLTSYQSVSFVASRWPDSLLKLANSSTKRIQLPTMSEFHLFKRE